MEISSSGTARTKTVAMILTALLLLQIAVLLWARRTGHVRHVAAPLDTFATEAPTEATTANIKRLAVLVIASRGAVGSTYEVYLSRLWPETIRRCARLGVDVFMVFGNDSSLAGLEGIPPANRIVAPFPETYRPGIMQKTAYAFRRALAAGYDGAFRTNISSVLEPGRLLEHATRPDGMTYSSGIVFHDMRAHLARYGEDPAFLATLHRFESDSYCSGSGFFIDRAQMEAVLRRLPDVDAADPEHRLIDDVVVGLCLPRGAARQLHGGFTEVFAEYNAAEWPALARQPFAHARLERLEADSALAVLDMLLGKEEVGMTRNHSTPADRTTGQPCLVR